jgi:hypothetical protein
MLHELPILTFTRSNKKIIICLSCDGKETDSYSSHAPSNRTYGASTELRHLNLRWRVFFYLLVDIRVICKIY